MIDRTTSFLVGVILVGTAAALAIADEPYPVIPDDALTPGAVASTNEAEVCGRNAQGLTYSQAHRQTPYALKIWIFREYGIAVPHGRARADWEIDHRVNLSLGGADVAANLWPEPSNRLVGSGGYEDKDETEVALWHAVCREHRMPLAEAQRLMLGDWRDAYRQVIGR